MRKLWYKSSHWLRIQLIYSCEIRYVDYVLMSEKEMGLLIWDVPKREVGLLIESEGVLTIWVRAFEMCSSLLWGSFRFKALILDSLARVRCFAGLKLDYIHEYPMRIKRSLLVFYRTWDIPGRVYRSTYKFVELYVF